MRWAPELRAPEDEWRAAMPEADAEGAILLGLNMVHIGTPHASILIDSGFDDPDSAWQRAYAAEVPGLRRSPELEAGLAAIGAAADEITHVLITHAHSDHYFGVTRDREGRRALRFPNARHPIGRQEWEGNPERGRRESDLAARLGTVESASLLDMVDSEMEVAPGVRMIPAPGESPGHCVVRLCLEGETFYYLGDLFHHPCDRLGVAEARSGGADGVAGEDRGGRRLDGRHDRLHARAVPALGPHRPCRWRASVGARVGGTASEAWRVPAHGERPLQRTPDAAKEEQCDE